MYNDDILCLQWTSCIHTHRKETCSTATQAHLPVYGIVVVLSTSEHVYGCNDYQVDAHAKVSKGQVTHEEPRNSQLGVAAWQHISGKREVIKMSVTSTNQAVVVPKMKVNNSKMFWVGYLIDVRSGRLELENDAAYHGAQQIYNSMAGYLSVGPNDRSTHYSTWILGFYRNAQWFFGTFYCLLITINNKKWSSIYLSGIWKLFIYKVFLYHLNKRWI